MMTILATVYFLKDIYSAFLSESPGTRPKGDDWFAFKASRRLFESVNIKGVVCSENRVG